MKSFHETGEKKEDVIELFVFAIFECVLVGSHL
jgi:hypothetical protein